MIHIKKQHELEVIHRLRTDILALRQRRVQQQSSLLQHKQKLLKQLQFVNERIMVVNNEIEQQGSRKDRTYNDQLQRLGGSAQQFTTLLERANQDNHQLQEDLRLKDDELKEFVSQLVKISDEANHRVNELTEIRKRIDTVKKRSEQIRNKQQLHRSQRSAAQQQIKFFQQLSDKLQKDKSFISEQLGRLREQNKGSRQQLNQRPEGKQEQNSQKDQESLQIEIVLLMRRHADIRKDIQQHKQRIVQEEARNHQKEEYLRRLKQKSAVLTQDCQDQQHQADSLRKQIQASDERRKKNREDLIELLERVERQERQNQRLKQLLEQNYRASQQAKELLLQRQGGRNEVQIPREYIRKGYHL